MVEENCSGSNSASMSPAASTHMHTDSEPVVGHSASLPAALQEKDEAMQQLEREVDALVKQLQPHPRAEAHRNKVFHYVEKLILFVAKELDMEEVYVCRFGSVPLKTYLLHGDLDLTAFAPNDKWLQRLKEKLEHEGQRESAANVVRGVHSVPHDLTRPTHADVVKVVKCQVDGIAVDVSANALGGLCTLCLLEKVDTMVGRDHLFKRSMVLVKAWCYFESHILSSQNGLLATYALETLVLCVFNLFHSQLRTPLEVLVKFLDYFAHFDWKLWTLTIRGPVPKTQVQEGGEVPLPRERPDSGLLLTDAALKTDPQLAALIEGLKDDNRLGFQVS